VKDFEEYDLTKKTIGCLQVLYRFIPFAMDDRAFLDVMFWVNEEENETKTYGVKLCESLLALLFKHGYAIKLAEGVDHDTFVPDSKGIDSNIVWRKGVSTVGEVPNSRRFGNNLFEAKRKWVLRVIMVLISQPLYYKPEEYKTILNPFCVYFTNKRAPYVKNFFISLLNTVIAYDTKGSGVPYFSSTFKYDSDVQLIEICLSVLEVLIEYKPPPRHNIQTLIEEGFVSVKEIRDQLAKDYVAAEGAEKEDIEETISNEMSVNELYRLV
jgi:hypothetical protein